MKRGEDMLARGDILAARLLYERAASSHYAPAATIVGKTYDPIFLADICAAGVKGEPTLAASWYQRAIVLGDEEARERLGRLKEYGLDHGINYAETEFGEAVRTLTGGKGADLIVDGVGGATLQSSLGCLAYRGRVITFGNAGRDMTTNLDIASMRGNNQTLVGYFLGAELFLTPRPRPMIAQLLDDVAAGKLKVVVDKEFPLEKAADAHAYIESRQAFGRVVLIP